MKNTFMTELKNFLEEQNNVSYTEKDGKGYATTKSAATDMFFKLSSYRNMIPEAIQADFMKICEENLEVAILFAFYCGDI